MKKGNALRIIVWGSIAIILALMGIGGLVLFNSGHGKIGSVMKETKPLAEKFNNLKEVNKYRTMGFELEAIAKGDQIVVIYNSTISKASYAFDYHDETGTRLLEISYNIADNNAVSGANVIVEFMIDAISVSKGYEDGASTKKYDLEDFENSTIQNGAYIRTVGDERIITLNMDTSVMDGNTDVTPSTPDTPSYALSLDDTDLIASTFIENKKASTSNDNFIIYAVSYENYYSIYIRDSKEIYTQDEYDTIVNLITSISGNDMATKFKTICPEFNNTDIQDEASEIKVKYNVTDASRFEQFNNKTNKILQVDVYYSEEEVSAQ